MSTPIGAPNITELTPYLVFLGAALGVLSALWAVLKGARAGVRADLRAIVREENQPLRDTQEVHSTRIERNELRLDRHEAQIGFLKERTAGVEAAVFKRPPVLEEDV